MARGSGGVVAGIWSGGHYDKLGKLGSACGLLYIATGDVGRKGEFTASKTMTNWKIDSALGMHAV